MPKIIAIAAPPGGGKTVLVQSLSKLLENACIVYFDHYQHFVQQTPEKIIAWMNAGADYNAFQLPQLVSDLAALKHGKTISDPATGNNIEPSPIILFETLFGRAHDATGRYIDQLIWLDTPLDIALARNIKACNQLPLQQNGNTQARVNTNFQAQQQWLQNYLENYLSFIAQTLRIQQQQVMPAADLIIDGCDTIENISHHLCQLLSEVQPQ